MISNIMARLIYVEWLDSFGCSSNWSEINNDANIEPNICKSVGWVYFESKKCIVIIPHLSDENHAHSKPHGCGDMTIPKAAIVKMKKLSFKK